MIQTTTSVRTSAGGNSMSSEVPARPPLGLRTTARKKLGVLGGIAAQFSQALASLVLQIFAARVLGAEGLGAFAVLFGVVVMMTAVSTGLVGDSLTVLDRSNPAIRSALQRWLLVAAASAVVVGFAVGHFGGFLTAPQAALFGVAAATFLVEDVLRRLLMARLRFWRIVVVDLVGLLGVVAVLGLQVLGGAELGLAGVVLALLVGQLAAGVVALALVGPEERWLAPWRGADAAAVMRYGGVRAVQQFVRPALLTAVRFAVIGVAGLAAMGALEAARIYTAPLLLVVSGASSFLFASYASATSERAPALLRRADRGVLALVAVTLGMSLIAVAGIDLVGPWLTDDSVALSPLAVLGWCAYAACVATVTPYGALAAVRSRQRMVLVLRAAESVVALIGVVILLAFGASPALVPMVLALGSLLCGVAIRQLLLAGRRASAPDDARVRG